MTNIISWERALHSNNEKYKGAFDNHLWSNSVVPIISENVKSQSSLSSCCFVTYRGYYFLLTAQHCIVSSSEQFVNPMSGISFNIGQLEWTYAENKNKDIAFSRIAHPEEYGLNVECFIDINQQLPRVDNERFEDYYLALGYPDKRNKQFKLKGGINRFSTFIHHANRGTESAVHGHESKELIFNKDIHVGCDFTLKKQFYTREGQQVEQMFKPEGMSGGALIYVNDIHSCANGAPAKFRLAGIIIGLKRGIRISQESKDILMATRVGVITTELDSYIDSRYLNNNQTL